ncbi:MAG: hypothetical protein WBY53_17555 [Acidobacteriaceae bacterium]
MTRLELLTIVVGRARGNGFEFRRWYTHRLGLPWITAEASLKLLDQQRRYYALLFSHEFACAFWKAGEEITFSVPAQSFQRPMPDGSLKTVQRKGFIRRSARRDAWRYHLREMALAEEPLRYLRKYLNVEEDLTEDVAMATSDDTLPTAPIRRTKPRPEPPPAKSGRAKVLPRPLPTELPAFLTRPFKQPN